MFFSSKLFSQRNYWIRWENFQAWVLPLFLYQLGEIPYYGMKLLEKVMKRWVFLGNEMDNEKDIQKVIPAALEFLLIHKADQVWDSLYYATYSESPLKKSPLIQHSVNWTWNQQIKLADPPPFSFHVLTTSHFWILQWYLACFYHLPRLYLFFEVITWLLQTFEDQKVHQESWFFWMRRWLRVDSLGLVVGWIEMEQAVGSVSSRMWFDLCLSLEIIINIGICYASIGKLRWRVSLSDGGKLFLAFNMTLIHLSDPSLSSDLSQKKNFYFFFECYKTFSKNTKKLDEVRWMGTN